MADMTSKRSTERRFRYLLHAAGAAVTVGILSLVVTVGVLPVEQRQQSLAEQTAATRDFMTRADDINRQQQELLTRVRQTERQFADAMTRIPETAQESEFLAQVSELARHAELDIHEFRPASVTERSTHRELEISISAAGPYHGLCDFVSGLDNLPRLCRVKSLIVDRDAAGTSESYPVQMSVVVYFQPLPSTTGDRNDVTI